MSEQLKESSLTPEQADIYKTVDNVTAKLNVLENFIARRFDEISMEINATAMQADMAEEGISKRFSEILEVISAINYSGDGTTAANTGVELEAVIKETEVAANKILDAADRIVEHVSDDKDWDNKEVRDQMRENIKNDIQDILMACTFQDLAGQRIRNTLDNLHNIEEKLNSSFKKLGINVKASEEKLKEKTYTAVDQDGVDALFDDDSKKTNSDKSSQEDIDSLFD